MSTQKTCMQMFNVSLFITAKHDNNLTFHQLRNVWIKCIIPHSGILFSNKKEGSTNGCYNIDEPWKHYVK